MKKILTMLCGSLMVLLLFVDPGSQVYASELESVISGENEPCPCEIVTLITGADKNKIVADILKTEAFNEHRKEQKNEGFKWNGAREVQVLYNEFYDIIIVGIPFTGKDGTQMMTVFIEGVLQGVSDPNEEHSH